MSTQEFTIPRVSETTISIKGYLQIARFDHWFKNIFMLFGVLLAYFHHPFSIRWPQAETLILAFFATCFIASSNYVINEIKDARYDAVHPKKKYRPIPSGRVNIRFAYVEWLIFVAIGLLLAAQVNLPFLVTIFAFLMMGFLYNVYPFRLKDLPYLDVLSESVNNPIRLLLGWFAVEALQFPSVSLLLAYWLIGAFFMATKRFAEYRHIDDPIVAGKYRRSFRYYNESRLITSMTYYICLFALFFGIFIIKYHFELILCAPFVAGFISYYVKIGFKKDSAVQNPEHLYREKGLMAYATICFVLFIVLLLVNIPSLYEMFNVEPSGLTPLWTF